MHINYNRLSRAAWISDDNGHTVGRTVAKHGERVIDAAGKLLTEHGYARTGEYLLAGEGSPVRIATVCKMTDAEARGAAMARMDEFAAWQNSAGMVD